MTTIKEHRINRDSRISFVTQEKIQDLEDLFVLHGYVIDNIRDDKIKKILSQAILKEQKILFDTKVEYNG